MTNRQNGTNFLKFVLHIDAEALLDEINGNHDPQSHQNLW